MAININVDWLILAGNIIQPWYSILRINVDRRDIRVRKIPAIVTNRSPMNIDKNFNTTFISGVSTYQRTVRSSVEINTITWYANESPMY